MEQLNNILFIDIETVSVESDYSFLSASMQEHWQRKARFLKSATQEEPTPARLFAEKAGIFSEFAKVVCIGIGCLVQREKEWKILLKSLTGNDEKVLLKSFCEAVGKFAGGVKQLRFCGHNIREFDLPFLCRRMIINGLALPDCLQLSGRKPWEIEHRDTLELWKFGDYKHFTSLALLADILGIPSPKDDMDGSMVSLVYWQEKDLQRIADYCMQDVLTTARVFLRLKNINIDPEPVYIND